VQSRTATDAAAIAAAAAALRTSPPPTPERQQLLQRLLPPGGWPLAAASGDDAEAAGAAARQAAFVAAVICTQPQVRHSLPPCCRLLELLRKHTFKLTRSRIEANCGGKEESPKTAATRHKPLPQGPGIGKSRCSGGALHFF